MSFSQDAQRRDFVRGPFEVRIWVDGCYRFTVFCWETSKMVKGEADSLTAAMAKIISLLDGC